jgi:cell wall-associated NlpC family hydrolase
MNHTGLLRQRLLAVALLVSLVLVAPLVGLGSPAAARADPLGDARARAVALTDQVSALRARTERAVEHYDLVHGQLSVAVAEHGSAAAQAEAAARALAGEHDLLADRARALYMSGGELTLYGTALQAATPAVLVDRIELAQRIAAATRAAGESALAAATRTAEALRRAGAVAARQSELELRAAIAAADVTSLLRTTQALLSGADAEVQRLQKEEEQRRAEQAQARFTALLARVRAGREAGGSGAALLGGAIAATRGDEVPAGPPQAAALAAIATRDGSPYLWGGTGPGRYDCSGLTGFAYFQAGIRLPRTAAQQWEAGPRVDLADLRGGDLLYWANDVNDPATIHHVALYAGNGLMWSANHTGDIVRLQPVWGQDGFLGANRPTSTGASAVSPPFWSGS